MAKIGQQIIDAAFEVLEQQLLNNPVMSNCAGSGGGRRQTEACERREDADAVSF